MLAALPPNQNGYRTLLGNAFAGASEVLLILAMGKRFFPK
jgi:hypothetical protein